MTKPRRSGACFEHGAPDVLSKPRRFGACFEHGAPDDTEYIINRPMTSLH